MSNEKERPQVDVFVGSGRESLKELREKESISVIPLCGGFDRRHLGKYARIESARVK